MSFIEISRFENTTIYVKNLLAKLGFYYRKEIVFCPVIPSQ